MSNLSAPTNRRATDDAGRSVAGSQPSVQRLYSRLSKLTDGSMGNSPYYLKPVADFCGQELQDMTYGPLSAVVLWSMDECLRHTARAGVVNTWATNHINQGRSFDVDESDEEERLQQAHGSGPVALSAGELGAKLQRCVNATTLGHRVAHSDLDTAVRGMYGDYWKKYPEGEASGLGKQADKAAQQIAWTASQLMGYSAPELTWLDLPKICLRHFRDLDGSHCDDFVKFCNTKRTGEQSSATAGSSAAAGSGTEPPAH